MTTPTPTAAPLTLDYDAGWQDGHAAGVRYALNTAKLIVGDSDPTLHAPAIRELARMLTGSAASGAGGCEVVNKDGSVSFYPADQGDAGANYIAGWNAAIRRAADIADLEPAIRDDIEDLTVNALPPDHTPDGCVCPEGECPITDAPLDGDYRQARGAVPWQPGMELPEDVIARLRGPGLTPITDLPGAPAVIPQGDCAYGCFNCRCGLCADPDSAVRADVVASDYSAGA